VAQLKAKVAIVTGAGSGIGRAIAERFAAEGARVICADISGHETATAQSIGEAATPVHVDVSKAEDVAGMIALTRKQFGRLDVLCNNAGWGGINQLLVDTSEEYFDRMVAVNLKSVFLGMKFGIPIMIEQRAGSIINTSSASGLVGWPGIAVYSATKGGVIQMSKSAALEYADKGVRVNAICPGLTWTGAIHGSTNLEAPPADRVAEDVPMRRWAHAREIASAAVYLASDESSYVTGHAMAVDGGYVAR
jgi:NAD(P)-dependent dehydrogenase (short-subunit alcohol dehydrogenase family)